MVSEHLGISVAAEYLLVLYPVVRILLESGKASSGPRSSDTGLWSADYRTYDSFLWEDRVIFGVLTFLGIAMLLMIPLDRLIAGVQRHMNATIGNAVGLVCSLAVFVITRNVNRGSLGFEAWIFYQMPEEVYQGDLTAYLGFPGQGFYSTDYFSLFPWFFLFLAGYFLYHLTKKNRQYTAEDSGLGTEQEKTIEKKSWLSIDIKPFSFLGRYSLLIYMLHQPVLFGLFMLLFQS